jgi:hypothetical protein
MASLRTIMQCADIDTSGSFSVLRRLFGFRRSRVPTDGVATTVNQVSVLQKIEGIQSKHINLNVIRVGFDLLSDEDLGLEKLDYAILRIHQIYRPVGLGIGRVEHYIISSADADGADDLGSEDEADELSDDWSVYNNGIDVFVVRNISDDDFVGISPVGGDCDKPSKRDGLVAGEIGRTHDAVARTFAHEVGHFLDLSHNHGGDPDCPGTTNGCNNLMAQTRCANSCGGGVKVAVLLTSSQGNTMKDHCSVQNAC